MGTFRALSCFSYWNVHLGFLSVILLSKVTKMPAAVRAKAANRNGKTTHGTESEEPEA